MANLTPRTRSESFLNGEDLEPITRREHFYAGRENELPEGHQEPETREEWFIQKYREAGDVTVESLSVTENGTYTAPSGKAYSPVSVNVPLPQNAYLLQTIEHEQVATFSDGTDNFLKSLEVGIESQQDLHGYDSPWVGGAGKNKMPLSFTDGSQTNGITIHKNSDGTIKITGKATAQAVITIGEYTTPIAQSIKYSGAVGGSGTTYSVNIAVNNSFSYSDVYNGDSSTVDVQANDVIKEVVIVRNGYECPSSGIIFYPMVRNSAESSAFAPYSNVCPISGWDECNVTVADATADPTVSNVYIISLNGTRYGGKLDVVNGVLTVDRAIKEFNGGSDESWDYNLVPNSFYQAALQFSLMKNSMGIISNEFETISVSDRGTKNGIVEVADKIIRVALLPDFGISSPAQWATWLASNPLEVVYELATPITIQLSPTIVKSLQGENNFFASTGDVERLQYWSKEVN